MRPGITVALVGISCLAAGALIQRAYDAHRLQSERAVASESASAEHRHAGQTAGASEEGAADFDREPIWAYGFDTPPKLGDTAQRQPPPGRNLRPGQDAGEQTRLRRLEGSTRTFSLIDIRDLHNVIDWFPSDHPPMPPVVAHGPGALGVLGKGCGSCHLPNGRGRPENAPVAGLPAAYSVRQLQDFRNGRRRSADPRKPNTNTMIEMAKALTDDEMKVAAEYFGSMPATPWIRVVESELVPRVRLDDNLFVPAASASSEPIAGRIVEMPESEEQSEIYRNPRSGFVAYVPPGSVAAGQNLVTTGGSRTGDNRGVPKTLACTACHGADLTGVADVPPLAGRSPSYFVRQLWDIKQGTRNGAYAAVMKVVVANLAPEDMRAIAAYLASREPGAAAAADVR